MYRNVRDILFKNTYMYKLQLTAILVDYYLPWATRLEMPFSGSSESTTIYRRILPKIMHYVYAFSLP